MHTRYAIDLAEPEPVPYEGTVGWNRHFQRAELAFLGLFGQALLQRG
jgi:hypothetical protein